jgi:hypothetical protein
LEWSFKEKSCDFTRATVANMTFPAFAADDSESERISINETSNKSSIINSRNGGLAA